MIVPTLSPVNTGQQIWSLARNIGALFPGTSKTAEQLDTLNPDIDGDEGGRSLLSAATKFLWFAGRRDVRIYDGQAYAALFGKQKYGSPDEKTYPKFLSEWERQFQQDADEIDNAINSFQASVLLEWTAVSDLKYREAQIIMRSKWFKARVFDKYLWLEGARILDEIEQGRMLNRSSKNQSTSPC